MKTCGVPIVAWRTNSVQKAYTAKPIMRRTGKMLRLLIYAKRILKSWLAYVVAYLGMWR